MLTRQTTYNWTPDTCQCKVGEIVDWTFDPTVDNLTWFTVNGLEVKVKGRWIPDPGTHRSSGSVAHKCDAHKAVADADLYDVVRFKEDAVKNIVKRILEGKEGITDLGLEEQKANGGIELKDGIEYNWAFVGEGADREFQFEVKGAVLTPDQEAAITALCDIKFGAAKVVVNPKDGLPIEPVSVSLDSEGMEIKIGV